jgi:hypothetical protein
MVRCWAPNNSSVNVCRQGKYQCSHHLALPMWIYVWNHSPKKRCYVVNRFFRATHGELDPCINLWNSYICSQTILSWSQHIGAAQTTTALGSEPGISPTAAAFARVGSPVTKFTPIFPTNILSTSEPLGPENRAHGCSQIYFESLLGKEPGKPSRASSGRWAVSATPSQPCELAAC